MAQALDKNLLHGRWVHAREEDTPTEMVYRPADYSLPPSRGRSGLEFKADGTFKRIGIGQTDISSVEQGAWNIDDANAGYVRVQAEGEPEIMKIEELTPDRLVVKRD